MPFNTILEGKPQPIQQIAMQLKGLALKTDKLIQEHIYGGTKSKVALYSIGRADRVLFGIQLNDNYCILYFHYTDTADTMSLKLEGEGKHAKHVKITAMTPELEAEIKQVMKNVLKASKN
jgi:hypothetical protein